MRREVILECMCGRSELYTPTERDVLPPYAWCDCGGLLEPVAYTDTVWAIDRGIAGKEGQ